MPGAGNASCDIDAYKWPPAKKGDASLVWKFEVKARSGDYSKKDAIKDLVKKCGDHEEKEGLHHAMLIALRGTLKQELCVWMVEKQNQKYFRIVMLVSGRAGRK